MKKMFALVCVLAFAAMATAQGEIKDYKYPRGRVESAPHVVAARHVDRFKAHRYRNLVQSLEVKALPDKFDVRNLGWTYDPNNQGPCGDCYGESTTWVVSCQFKKAGLPNFFKFQYGLDCKSLGGCSGGDEAEVIDIMHKQGWPDDKAYPYPYEARSRGCRALKSDLTKVENWGYCTPAQQYGIAATNDVKLSIMTHGAVSTAVYANSDWDNAGKKPMPMRKYGANACNHAVAIVGWVDDSTLASGGYWIVMMDWGPGAGDNGYCYVQYGSHAICTEAFWVSMTPVAPPPPDPPNPPPPPPPVPPPPGPTPTPGMLTLPATITLRPDGTWTKGVGASKYTVKVNPDGSITLVPEGAEFKVDPQSPAKPCNEVEKLRGELDKLRTDTDAKFNRILDLLEGKPPGAVKPKEEKKLTLTPHDLREVVVLSDHDKHLRAMDGFDAWWERERRKQMTEASKP